MDLDLIYLAEMQSRHEEKQTEKYKAVDYFDIYDSDVDRRNEKKKNAKYYDSYENKFNY